MRDIARMAATLRLIRDGGGMAGKLWNGGDRFSWQSARTGLDGIIVADLIADGWLAVNEKRDVAHIAAWPDWANGGAA